MENPPNLVYLKCVKDGNKLRIRIISQGYNNDANVQFPKNIRKVGRIYTVPSYSVSFRKSVGGKLFYHVDKRYVTIVEEQNVEIDFKVFEVDQSPDCVICMSELKSIIFSPCGHYCTCPTCAQSINDKCPICRAKISNYVTKDELFDKN